MNWTRLFRRTPPLCFLNLHRGEMKTLPAEERCQIKSSPSKVKKKGREK